ncbi:hypothetical protein NDU88_004175 [Pleurodeles waltl]|uniref:Uncharacterized protein n=1 Tax=Pleurodeles waltl TaxID=8319 RepID=A0AAV7RK94_PLEWA|nr:hypothetical protein NDU88_004175 [Pleurodeles waltl]
MKPRTYQELLHGLPSWIWNGNLNCSFYKTGHPYVWTPFKRRLSFGQEAWTGSRVGSLTDLKRQDPEEDLVNVDSKEKDPSYPGSLKRVTDEMTVVDRGCQVELLTIEEGAAALMESENCRRCQSHNVSSRAPRRCIPDYGPGDRVKVKDKPV